MIHFGRTVILVNAITGKKIARTVLKVFLNEEIVSTNISKLICRCG